MNMMKMMNGKEINLLFYEVKIMKTKMKAETKKKILTILSIVSFIIIVVLDCMLLPENYGWIKY